VPTDSPLIEARQMRDKLEWPVRDGDVDRRGADVLSGFTGEPVGTVQEDIRGTVAGQFIDARAGPPEGDEDKDRPWKSGVFDDEVELTGGVTILGTNDPGIATNPETAPNIYMHELGHILGGIHPGDTAEQSEFKVEGDGVMCKDSCAKENIERIGLEAAISRGLLSGTIFGPNEVDLPEAQLILNAEFYSEDNKHRILNLDYDYMDAEDPIDIKEGENPADSINRDRNLTSVATAASIHPPNENVDIGK